MAGECRVTGVAHRVSNDGRSIDGVACRDAGIHRARKKTPASLRAFQAVASSATCRASPCLPRPRSGAYLTAIVPRMIEECPGKVQT